MKKHASREPELSEDAQRVLQAVRSVLANVGAAVLLFILANLAALLLDKIHLTKEFHFPEHETVTRPNGFVPYRLRFATKEFHGKQLNTDRDGWRTGTPSGGMFDAFSPDDYNVFLIGGSALFGWSVDDDQTIAAHLERLVAAKTAGKRAIRIFNMGLMGHCSRDEVPLLVEQLRLGRVPDLVVFYDGGGEKGSGLPGNQYDNIQGKYIDADYTYWVVIEQFNRGQNLFNPEYLPIWNFLQRPKQFMERRQRRQLLHEEVSPELRRKFSEHAHDAARTYVSSMGLVSKLAQGYRFKAFFFLGPEAACWDDYAAFSYPFSGPPSGWDRAYLRLVYSSIADQSKAAGLPVTDLSPVFKAALPEGMQPFNSYTHLNGEGNKLVASILYRDMEADLK